MRRRVGLGDGEVEDAAAPDRGQLVPVAEQRHPHLALVGDRKMRDLNSRFRAIDQVTDVLSFPAGPAPAATSPGADRFLGDIVIATGRAARQARAAGVTEQQEWRRLALHGLLHLLGYDHERDGGQMLRLERRLQRKGGLLLA